MPKFGETKFNKCIRKKMKHSKGLTQQEIRAKFKKAAKSCKRTRE
jgi:hypothetical protein